ncbi:MAG: HAMP domain-containing histidine kinase [Ruminiclostridium sp.]|nr:HAMP domain-containing histidine kinase [Ruminiclostridium sp.]
MIKKLRRNFIIAAVISVAVVLAIIVAVMNAANYLNSDNEADELLGLLADNNGSFGQGVRMTGDRIRPPSGSSRSDDDDDTDDEADDETDDDSDDDDADAPPKPPEGEMQQDPKHRFGERGFVTAETPYETRYFTAVLRDNGDPVSIDTGKIAAVGTEEALGMAREALSGGRETGYSGTFKYLITKKSDRSLCIFVDRSRAMRSLNDFLMISVLVSVGALAAISVLIFFVSGLVIKPVAESYEKQKKFITNAGHELKTPLAVINSCNEVIEMEQGESKWTRGIAIQTERLAGLTKELVALARMDEGSVKPNFESFLLSETAEEILDPFTIMAEQKGIEMSTEIAPDIYYKGDRSLIAKLCSILADNAVKYTPEGGRIKFTLSAKGRRVLLISENTAENMEKGAHPELFDRFRRGDSSHSSDTPGYGIGLSMAQSVVQVHGGRIDAVSKDGTSLTITVRL